MSRTAHRSSARLIAIGLAVAVLAGCAGSDWPPELDGGIVRVTADEAVEVPPRGLNARRIADTSIQPIRMAMTPWGTTVLSTAERPVLEVGDDGRIADRDPDALLIDWSSQDPLLAVSGDLLVVVDDGDRLSVVTENDDAAIVIDDLGNLVDGAADLGPVRSLAGASDGRVVLGYRSGDDRQVVALHDLDSGATEVLRGIDDPWIVGEHSYFASAVVGDELWVASSVSTDDDPDLVRITALDLTDGSDRIVGEEIDGGPFITSMTAWNDGVAIGLSSNRDGTLVAHVAADGSSRPLIGPDDVGGTAFEGVLAVGDDGLGWLSVQLETPPDDGAATGRYQYRIDLSELDAGS